MTPGDATAAALVVLAALLTFISGGIMWVVNRQTRANVDFRVSMAKISQDLAVLNAGASLGARELFDSLHRRFSDLEAEFERMESRHTQLATSFEILADRLNRTIRDQAYRAAGLHPPSLPGDGPPP